MSARETEHGKIALQFAAALVNGEFEEAHLLLSADCQREWSPEALREEYEQMLEYVSTPVSHLEVMNTLEEWPAKREADIGWAYVAMSGDNFSEAVSVVVELGEDGHRIREIEWGRP